MQSIEPIEYIRGYTEFLGCKIDLSQKPLIPRPETEYWVNKVIKQIDSTIVRTTLSRISHTCVLDLFCGSGCIGLAISRHVKNARVTFADKYQYFKHPNFIKSDVFSNIRGKYDYIFANPPYVATSKKYLVQKSVLKFEPKQALFGGADGLFYIKKFLKEARTHLNPGGKIFMEFSPEQKEEIEKIIKRYKYSNYNFHRDQFNRWRWVDISI